MAVTEFKISGIVKIAHPDGVRFRKSFIAARLREILEESRDDAYEIGVMVSKAKFKVER